MPRWPNRSREERFWEKVTKTDDCWTWTACLNNKGYGTFVWSVSSILAHRASWMLLNGEIPDKLHVLHRCDNPLCVRPDHLFLGTHKDNMMDCAAKGRFNHAKERNPMWGKGRLLTREDAHIIRDEPGTLIDIAKRWGISKGMVSLIKRNRSWHDSSRPVAIPRKWYRP